MRNKKEINIQIGEQVRIARESKKLTQEALSERIDGSPQYISDLERGVVGISLPTLKRMCQILGVSRDQLLFGHQTADRAKLLANLCASLTDAQFDILVEMIHCYMKAVK